MRDRVISAIITSLFIFLWIGLFYTQIIRSGYYTELSKNNSIRLLPIDGPRGDILDRKGRVLATNRLSFDVAVIYNELKDRTALARILKRTMGMSGPGILKALEESGRRPYVPVVIAEDIDKEKAMILEEASFDVDGLVIQTRARRDYRYKDSCCHLLGYLGEISEEDLASLGDYGYRKRDLVGRGGLEKYYDIYLKGTDGGVQVEVDNRGRQKRILGVKEPKEGKDLRLTIDLDLQLASDRGLGDRAGAVIVINPKTGEVLALSSHPAFDPNIFIRAGTSKERMKLLGDKMARPIFDRAVSGLYPPGSIFKIVTAAAALETGRITPYSSFMCSGSYTLGRRTFNCWKKGGHGAQNLRQGLMNSCNVYFYNIGRAAGVDAIETYAKIFGFGALTGIDLPDEVRGTAPGRPWKRARKNENWYEGETLNYAIGQGYLMVTPIQASLMISAVANEGKIPRPYLASRIGDRAISVTRPRETNIKKSTISNIRHGLFDVVNGPNGTGRLARVEGVLTAGKTGTAENPLGRTHAWFAGFAPYSDPSMCVVVLLEHGGKGGVFAAEIARGIFEEAKLKGCM